MPAPNEILPQQLLRLIGLPDAPVIIDVSLDPDFEADPFLIPGATRHDHRDTNGLLPQLEGQRCVVVCQKGRKLSQGVAALLRSYGVRAEYLGGGNHAWRALPDAPRLPASMLTGTALWVTRHRPKIDRVACPWLIRRIVNPAARFLFVAPAEVLDVAERFGATPFDIDGAFWSHRGDGCTFDTMLDEFCLHSAALDRLVRVIRAADTNQPDSCPQAAGLLAVSVGLSRQYKDDLTQLEAGMVLYDALYCWARDGADEVHDSTQSKT